MKNNKFLVPFKRITEKIQKCMIENINIRFSCNIEEEKKKKKLSEEKIAKFIWNDY